MRGQSWYRVALLSAIAAGCGGTPPAPTTGPQASLSGASIAPSTSPTAQPAATSVATPDQGAYNRCKDIVGKLIDELSDLDAAITVGVRFEPYGDAVTSLLKVYNRSDFDSLGVDDYGCLSDAGVPAEAAVNAHLKAHSAWDDCLDSFFSSARFDRCFDNRVQPQWTKATRNFEEAKDGLNALRA